MNKYKVTLAIPMLLVCSLKAHAAFIPIGPQNDVLVTDVTNTWGWTECYSTTYNTSSDLISNALTSCAGDNLMLAARQVGSTTFDVLAAASFADVTFESGRTNTTNTANGAEWYFNDSWSWGFAGLGDTVSRNSCDTAGSSERDRLCWHTTNGRMSSGYRSGNNYLNGNSTWEKVILTLDNSPVAASAPTSLLLFVLSLVGIGFRGKILSKSI